MIRPGFLDRESRQDLIELARNGSAAHRLARRANALVLLDDGMSCEAIAKVLLLDDDTIRTWYRLYEEDGIEGLASFGYEGGACRLSEAQQCKLAASWRNSRLNVSWLGTPFASLRKPRRNGSFALANSAMSTAPCPPHSTVHSAIISSSWKSCRPALPVRGSSRPSQQATN